MRSQAAMPAAWAASRGMNERRHLERRCGGSSAVTAAWSWLKGASGAFTTPSPMLGSRDGATENQASHERGRVEGDHLCDTCSRREAHRI